MKNHNFKIEVIKNLEKAQELWEQFSPKNNVWQTWDFRYFFYKYFNYELFFYLGYENGKPIGLLPLQYNKDKKYLEFFGGSFMEENQLFINNDYKELSPLFFESITLPLYSEEMIENSFLKLEFEDFKYTYSLNNCINLQEFLKKYFPSERMRKLRNKIKNTEKKYDIEVRDELNLETLFFLIKQNKKNFGIDSSFLFPHREEIMKDIFLNLKQKKYLISIFINGKPQAASFSIGHDKTFTFLAVGNNNEEFDGIGKYSILKAIDKALAEKYEIFDLCAGDCNWKEKWHADKCPLFKISKNIII